MSFLLRGASSLGSRALIGSSGLALCSLSSSSSLSSSPLLSSSSVSECSSSDASSSSSFASEMSELRKTEKEMRSRWIRDEENWRKLPARCWPEKQPNLVDIPSLISASVANCAGDGPAAAPLCLVAKFELATALIFNDEDAKKGFASVCELAEKGAGDGICLAGVCLVEGYGTQVDIKKGVDYLQRGAAIGHGQSHYELASLYYTGAAAPFLPENDQKALEHFEKAAEISNYSYALFMIADILLERTESVKNCSKEVDNASARALRLLYAAAERGHRFARQEIISLLERRHRLTKSTEEEIDKERTGDEK